MRAGPRHGAQAFRGDHCTSEAAHCPGSLPPSPPCPFPRLQGEWPRQSTSSPPPSALPTASAHPLDGREPPQPGVQTLQDLPSVGLLGFAPCSPLPPSPQVPRPAAAHLLRPTRTPPDGLSLPGNACRPAPACTHRWAGLAQRLLPGGHSSCAARLAAGVSLLPSLPAPSTSRALPRPPASPALLPPSQRAAGPRPAVGPQEAPAGSVSPPLPSAPPPAPPPCPWTADSASSDSLVPAPPEPPTRGSRRRGPTFSESG